MHLKICYFDLLHKIIAPSNPILHNKIYTISYLDDTIINLFDTPFPMSIQKTYHSSMSSIHKKIGPNTRNLIRSFEFASCTTYTYTIFFPIGL